MQPIAPPALSRGSVLWRNVRFHCRAEELEELWRRIPDGEVSIIIVIEPTRNAWVSLDMVMVAIMLLFVIRWSDPHQVLRLGQRRLVD